MILEITVVEDQFRGIVELLCNPGIEFQAAQVIPQNKNV